MTTLEILFYVVVGFVIGVFVTLWATTRNEIKRMERAYGNFRRNRDEVS